MILGTWMILVVYLRTEFGVILDFLYWATAGLSDIHGLSIASNPESPIVFLILEKSTGSMKNDLQLLEDIADWVSIVLWRHTRIFICYLFSQYLCWFGFLLLLHLQALKEDGVFVVTSKRSMLDKCRLPVGIRLFVSAAHSEADLVKACESLKRISAVVLRDRNWVIHTASHTAPVTLHRICFWIGIHLSNNFVIQVCSQRAAVVDNCVSFIVFIFNCVFLRAASRHGACST